MEEVLPQVRLHREADQGAEEGCEADEDRFCRLADGRVGG